MLNGQQRRRRGLGGIGLGDLGAVESMVWPTTGDLDTESESLALSVSALGHDIAVAFVPSGTAEWDRFQNAWNNFVTDFLQWKESPWFWNPSRRDQLIGYRAQFNTLRDAFLQLGPGAATSISPVSGDHPEPDSLDKVMTAVKWTGIAVGVYLGYRVVHETGLLRGVAKR